jgi:hypothetical protein
MEKYNEVTSAIMEQKVKDFIHDSFGHFFANTMDSEDVCLGIEKIWGYSINERSRELINYTLSFYGREYENYPCNEDGATPFQDYEMECIVDSCVDEILFHVWGNAENLND